jgi:putative DNA primase/helicase
VIGALSAVCQLASQVEAPAWLSPHGNGPFAGEFLAVHNGLLHLPSGELLPASANYFGLNCAGVAYDQDACDPAEWKRFLKQLWPNDQQSIDTLQEWFGYLLAPGYVILALCHDYC